MNITGTAQNSEEQEVQRVKNHSQETWTRWSCGQLFKLTSKVVIMALFFGVGSMAVQAVPTTGKIKGIILSEENAEPIIGATVQIEGTAIGTMADIDGQFLLKDIPAGVHSIVISCIGYSQKKLTEVTVVAGEISDIQATLSESVHELDMITVRERGVKNTEATMLLRRSKASAISDAISAEQISRSGSSNAADAMTKVTGVSVVGGRFVYVRGLGDRYSNTQLNGSPLPTPTPDKQAVPVDLIPAGLLDNIVVEKTFTPDRPGDFAGGSVNLETRDYPDKRTLKFSTSSSYNSISTFNENAIGQATAGSEWLGYDNGQRDIPDYIEQNSDRGSQVPEGFSFVNVPADSIAQFEPIANYMDSATKSFNSEMQPSKSTIPLNQSYSVMFGDRWELFEKQFGVVASLSYSQNHKFYENGFDGRYRQAGVESSELTVEHELNDTKNLREVLWGGMLSLNYGLGQNHKVGLNYMYNRNGETVTRILTGEVPEFIDPGDEFRSRVLQYTERLLQSVQLNGEHFGFLGDKTRTKWQASWTETSQNEPDVRFFNDEKSTVLVEDEDSGDLYEVDRYDIRTSRYPRPQRAWRSLDESNKSIKADMIVPYGTSSKLKFGASLTHKQRTHRERRFEYIITDNYTTFDGDIDAYSREVGISRVDTLVWAGDTTYQYRFSNYLSENVELRNQYDGEQDVVAGYGMTEMQLTQRLKMIAGARIELTDMLAVSQDESFDAGVIDKTNLLPSINLVYQLSDNMNLRGSATRTLARPTLREKSPFASEEFGISRIRLGNPDLRMTLIDNYDARWEWFIGPGELYAISGFYKKLKDPIEMVIIGVNGTIQPQNTTRANVIGLELEFRRSLKFLSSTLRNFRFSGNLTLVRSRVKIAEEELDRIRFYNHDASEERQMYGQSPYIVNLDVGYDHPKWGTSLSLFYNVFGERFAFNALDGTPDVYEQSRHQLDVLASQPIFGGASFKIGAKNLLGDDVEFLHGDFMGTQKVYHQHEDGRTYSMGISYDIW